jgi:hypothetical protein
MNSDIDYPEPNWDQALDYIMKAWKAEGADFLLVAGDMVWGRWPNDEQIETLGAKYYQAWIKRMRFHDLKFYVAVGDHEIGDNPWPARKVKLLPTFEKVFAEHFDMPKNGPDHMKGLAYYFRHKNCLFVSVNVFETVRGKARDGTESDMIRIGVTGKQQEWLEAVFKDNRDVDHIVVMGHTPVLGPIPNKGPSSRLMVRDKEQSSFWKLMAKYYVDLYLAGEHHVIDCKQADGIVQITHGTALGFFKSTNYLRATVTPKTLFLELKTLPIDLQGMRGDFQKSGVPHMKLSVSKENQETGFQTVGTLLIDKRREVKKLVKATGCFQSIGQ